MRNFFIAVCLFFTSSGFLFSQGFVGPPCTIYTAQDTINFLYPAADSFPCIDSGIAFYDAIQLNMPPTIGGIITLDSLVITSITGLPAGMGYNINPPSGVLYADANGCVAFAGTDSASPGSYSITFNGYAVLTSQNTGTHTYSLDQLAEIDGAPVPSYRLNVIGPTDTCNPQAYTLVYNVNGSPLFTVYPNPGYGLFELDLQSVKSVNSEIDVADLSGRIVYRASEQAGTVLATLNLSDLSKGFYILRLRTRGGETSKKISIQ